MTENDIADIFNGGVFEKDIILTVNQAFNIFSKYFNGSQSTRQKRKVLDVESYNPNIYAIPDLNTLWSQEPTINYIFDFNSSFS